MKKYFLNSWGIAPVITLAILLTASYSFSQDEQVSPLAKLAVGLQSRVEKVSFAQGYFVKESFFNGEQQVLDAIDDEQLKHLLQQPALLAQIFWTADNENRAREDIKYLRGVTEPDSYVMSSFADNTYQRYSQGSHVAMVNSDLVREQVSIGETAGWLQILNADDDDVQRLIEERDIRYVGQEKVNDINTQKIETVPKEGDRSIKTWWIAPSLNYLIIKKETRSLHENNDPNSKIRSFRHLTVVDKVQQEKEKGIYIPWEVRRIIFITINNGGKPGEIWERMERFSVSSFDTDEDTANSLFHFPLPIGTKADVGDGRVGGDVTSFEKRFSQGVTERMYSSNPIVKRN